MTNRILVPLDGSAFAESALPLAVAIARGAGATLELVSVVELMPTLTAGAETGNVTMQPTVGVALAAPPDLRDRAQRDRAAYLGEVTDRIGEAAGAVVESAVMDGDPSSALLNRAATGAIDLVVMSTHGRGPVQRAWLGSVADRLSRRLHVPLILIRPDESGNGATERPAPTPVGSVKVRRVLVTLDGSDLAEVVLGPAAEVARALGAPLSLLRVAGVRLYVGSPYLPHGAEEYNRQLEAERAEAEAYLRDVAASLTERGVDVEGHRVLQGPAATTILEAAQAETEGLIAMATHGRGGFQRLLLGSVSDKVVRGATAPVLLVRPADQDS